MPYPDDFTDAEWLDHFEPEPQPQPESEPISLKLVGEPYFPPFVVGAVIALDFANQRVYGTVTHIEPGLITFTPHDADSAAAPSDGD